MNETTRRQFLLQLGGGALAVVGVQFLSACEVIDVDPKGAGEGAEPFLTPAADGSWYFQSGRGLSKEASPTISRDEWRLRITAGNDTLAELDFDSLLEFEERGLSMSYWKTLRCVFSTVIGPPIATLVANGIFTGIPLHHVLEALDVPAEAVKMRVYGADGFSSNIAAGRTAAPASGDELPVLLAYGLNGEPLGRLRGGPVRLIIPETWGYKNVKWIERLDFTSDAAPFGTYEVERFPTLGLDDPGPFALSSMVTMPRANNIEIEGPDVTLAGIAVVGGAHIEQVELSLDDGPFEPAATTGTDRDEVFALLSDTEREAMLATVQDTQSWPLRNVWVTWSKTWTGLSPGEHAVTVRATDSNGRTQSSQTSNILQVANEVRMRFTVT